MNSTLEWGIWCSAVREGPLSYQEPYNPQTGIRTLWILAKVGRSTRECDLLVLLYSSKLKGWGEKKGHVVAWDGSGSDSGIPKKEWAWVFRSRSIEMMIRLVMGREWRNFWLKDGRTLVAVACGASSMPNGMEWPTRNVPGLGPISWLTFTFLIRQQSRVSSSESGIIRDIVNALSGVLSAGNLESLALWGSLYVDHV